ncbi:MAG: sigma 54-interacting transcriptional regulator [Carboxydocellales bacterium]
MSKKVCTRENFLGELFANFMIALQTGEDNSRTSGLVKQAAVHTGDLLQSLARERFNLTNGQLTPEQVGSILVKVIRDIGGILFLLESTPEKLVFTFTQCPFGQQVSKASGTCQVTSGLLGGVIGRNSGYAKVITHQTIVEGKDRCLFTVFSQPTLEAELLEGDEYISQDSVEEVQLTNVVVNPENRKAKPEQTTSGLGKAKGQLKDFVGQGKECQRIKELVWQAAQEDFPVLLIGEVGAGKGVLAQAIHNLSNYKEGPFIEINCNSVPEEYWEEMLFGPADTTNPETSFGKVCLANKGTLCLDGIGELPLYIQAELVRLLQDGELHRVSRNLVNKLDVRVIATTHVDLYQLVQKGSFRRDLFYRLNILPIKVPSLRDRKEDIPVIARSILAKINGRYGSKAKLTPEALQLLKKYSWPGNQLELASVLSRAVVESKGEDILVSHLPGEVGEAGEEKLADTALPTLDQQLARKEREIILSYLGAAAGNKAKTAKLLGISRQAFYEKLRKHGLGC